MKKFTCNIFIIVLLMGFTNDLKSQASLITRPVITTNNSNIEIAGILNAKSKFYESPLDTTELKIYGNDQLCKLLSLKESTESVIIHVFFEKNNYSNKTDKLIQTINELDTNCIATIEPQWHLIRNVHDKKKQKESSRLNKDTIANEISLIDTITFEYAIINDFINSLSRDTKTKFLILLYSNKKNKEFISIYSQVNNSQNNNNVLFGYISYSKDQFKPFVFFKNLYMSTKTFLKTKIFKRDNGDSTNNIFFVQYRIEDDDNNTFRDKLDDITNRYLAMTFEPGNTAAGSDTINYRIIYEVGDEHLSNSFTNIETNNKLTEIPTANIKIPKRIINLHDKYDKNPSDSIIRSARDLIIEYSKTDEINNNPDTLFKVSEGLWRFSPATDEWYKDLKISLLKNYLASKTKPEDRLHILNELIAISPNNKEYKLEKFKIKGDSYSKNKQYEKAVKNYSNYLILNNNDKAIQEKTLRNFELAFIGYYAEKDYASLYSLGTDYSNYYRSSNKMRYYYYQACYVEKDYDMSLRGFNWLIDNWDNNQTYLSWDGAFVMLEKLYTYNYKFDEALKLDKRLYRDTISEEALNLYIKNLRLKHLILISDAFPVFMQNVKSANKIKLLSANIPKVYPSFINGIFMKNKTTGNINQIVDYNSTSSPPINSLNDIQVYPAIISSKNGQNIWIINEQGNSFIIIDFSLKPIDIAENNLITGIKNNRLMVEPWEDLANFEAQFLQKYCTGILAGMISTELNKGFNGDIDTYWKAINKNSKLVYMLRYNKDGKIAQNKSFSSGKAITNSSLWTKSETAKAFFKQEITYDTIKVVDITNPLFKNKTWNGTLKIGFRK